ncbi:MAG: hypothetical protein SVW77_03770 [Candidatus Nanohaloarchaea archaeon]|nr:hypothetical protein [Candidatus Nanohaloarchaea archaeon]
MRTVAQLTPDRRKSAIIGIGFSLAGLITLISGSYVIPVPKKGRFFIGMTLIVFGVLLATVGVLVFVIPAAFDYWRDALAVTPGARSLS